MIVLDASAAIALLLSAEPRMAARISQPDESLHAPHLLDVEVAHVLRRLASSGELSEERGRRALEDLAALDLERHPHHAFLARIWALRRNVTAYDAAYLALAEALSAPLLTLDERLARSSGHRARIEILR